MPKSRNEGTFAYLLSAIKQRGPGEQGAAGHCPKILLLRRAKMVLCSSHRSHREICTRNRPVSEINFWMISGGPFLSWPPFCFTAEILGHPGHRSSRWGTRTKMFMLLGLRTKHINMCPCQRSCRRKQFRAQSSQLKTATPCESRERRTRTNFLCTNFLKGP